MGKGKNGADCSTTMHAGLLEQALTDPQALEALREQHPELMAKLEKLRWRLPEDREGQRVWEMASILAGELDLDPVTAYQLDREDFSVPLDADGNPLEEDFSYAIHRQHLDPGRGLLRSAEETMPGTREAAEALLARIQAGEKIAVFADYDIDGIGSAAVFSEAVVRAGGSEDQLIWQHARGGFGLTADFVRQAKAEGATMLVTLDCGSAQVGEIALACKLGLETLIIDHHDADPTTKADHHLNPRFLNLARDGEPFESVHQARMLLERADEAYRNKHLHPDDEQAQQEFDDCVTEAKAMIAHLDELSGASKPSTQLHLAIERAEQFAEPGLPNHNSAGQLTWKFGGALIEAAGGELDDSWYGTPLYLAGQAALGDAMTMDSSTSENRAFVRIPIDEQGDAPVPPLIRRLAAHFDEDPTDPASMVRTRGALNLAKRTVRMDAKLIADGLRAKTDDEVEQFLEPLLAEYDRCKALRDDEMIPAALADAQTRIGSDEPMVVSALLEGYPEDIGQARLLANRLAREYGVPAAVGVVDAQGIAKVSWSAPNDRLNFGQRALDTPKLRRMAKDACALEEVGDDGRVHVRYAVGGHTAVLSGSCPKERFEDFVAMGEEMGEIVCTRERNERLWRRRPWDGPPSAFADARMVGPERVHRIAAECRRLAPVTDFRREPRVSEAVRLVELGTPEAGAKTVPAVVEMTDGSRHQADLTADVSQLLGSGTWFEAVLAPGRKRWYLSTVAPLQ